MKTLSKIEWRFKRLALMSPAEMLSRTGEELKKQLESRRQGHIPLYKAGVHAKPPQWLSDKDAVRRIVREKSLWNEAPAKALLEHRFTFFALQDCDFGPAINWNQDYKNQKAAPIGYGLKLDYRDQEKVGDIKYIWEINRHAHLVTLAKAYFLTGHEAYKHEVEAQLESWMNQNPYLRGVNWASSLEAGIRLMAWHWVYYFLGDFSPVLNQRLRDSVYQHAHFIDKHFSKYSSANNHLIGEAAGLLVGALTWDFGTDSKKWAAKAQTILIREIGNQTFEDGVNKEQAVSYIQFVLDFFLMAGRLAEVYGFKMPASYWQPIEQMMVFLASIMDDRGNIPQIGDADDGFALALSEESRINPYRALLWTGAVLFKRGDFKDKVKHVIDEKSLWLLGDEALGQFNALPEKKFTARQSFEKGGYYILVKEEGTKNEVKCVFDCAPLGYLSLAAHGHADALSFTLSVGGRPILIDPGTYAYHTEKKWRDYFRGTSAHNTVQIDGKDQSVSGGNFMWLRKAKSSCLGFSFSREADMVCGSHDGYERLHPAVTHTRHLHFDKLTNQILCRDIFDSQGEYDLAQYFHFDAEWHPEKKSDSSWGITGEEFSIGMIFDPKLKWELVKGEEHPPLGWQSVKFDLKIPSATLTGKMRCRQKTELISRFDIRFQV